MVTSKSVRELFNYAKKNYRDGSKDNPFTIEIDSIILQVIFFPFDGTVSFGLFFPKQKYSRKTIFINDEGFLSEDLTSYMPDFDLTENEPDFKDFPIARIVEVVWQILLQHNIGEENGIRN